jgi:hypothetical protein
MHIVFFNNPIGTQKLNFVTTDKSVTELKNEGIVPKKSITLVKKYNPKMDFKEKALLVHIDKTVFDNYQTPTKVIFDLDLIKMFFIDFYRSAREDIFKKLDALQFRAMISGKQDVVSLIENDKIALRKMPADVSKRISSLTDFFEINKIIPDILLIDYDSKYSYMLK